MVCKVCKDIITIHDFDASYSFEEISPITFKKAKFHSYCYLLELEESKQTISENIIYSNRYDEYLTKFK